jgi:hypothetical protein
LRDGLVRAGVRRVASQKEVGLGALQRLDDRPALDEDP